MSDAGYPLLQHDKGHSSSFVLFLVIPSLVTWLEWGQPGIFILEIRFSSVISNPRDDTRVHSTALSSNNFSQTILLFISDT